MKKLKKNTKIISKSNEYYNMKGKVFRDYTDSTGDGIVLVYLDGIKNRVKIMRHNLEII